MVSSGFASAQHGKKAATGIEKVRNTRDQYRKTDYTPVGSTMTTSLSMIRGNRPKLGM